MLYDKRWDEQIQQVKGIADLLNRAADVIKRNGWCQDTAVDDKNRMCMVGALSHVVHQHDAGYTRDDIVKAEDILKDYLDVNSVVSWNDRFNMKLFFGKQRAINALRKAAARVV